MIEDAELDRQADIYLRTKDSLWVHATYGNRYAFGKCTFSQAGPPARVPNPDVHWKHPTFEEYLIAEMLIFE